MTKQPTAPGQRCRIVGSQVEVNTGKAGPNKGKHVVTVFLHQTKAGNDEVPVWRVRSAVPGMPLITGDGAVGDHVDCLSPWLELVEDEPPAPAVRATEREVAA